MIQRDIIKRETSGEERGERLVGGGLSILKGWKEKWAGKNTRQEGYVLGNDETSGHFSHAQGGGGEITLETKPPKHEGGGRNGAKGRGDRKIGVHRH